MNRLSWRKRPSRAAWSRTCRVVLAGLAVTLAGAAKAHAVTVAPSALYIGHQTRTATLTLHNPGTLAEEIEISFAFGYPTSDGQGNVSVNTVPADSAPAGEPSAAGWIRAFPRRLRLEPGQRQVVRVMVQPPANLPDGEYWARVLVSSTGGRPPVEQVLDSGIRVQIDTRMVVVTALSYRKGPVQTGVAVKRAAAESTSEGVALTLDFARQGNAAFLGRVRAELVAPNGQVLAQAEDDMAVYRELRRVLRLAPPGGTAPRGATIRYVIDTERQDIPPGGALPAPTVRGTVPVA